MAPELCRDPRRKSLNNLHFYEHWGVYQSEFPSILLYLVCVLYGRVWFSKFSIGCSLLRILNRYLHITHVSEAVVLSSRDRNQFTRRFWDKIRWILLEVVFCDLKPSASPLTYARWYHTRLCSTLETWKSIPTTCEAHNPTVQSPHLPLILENERVLNKNIYRTVSIASYLYPSSCILAMNLGLRSLIAHITTFNRYHHVGCGPKGWRI